MAASSPSYQPLVSSPDCIFYDAPEKLQVDASFPGTLHIRADKDFFFEELKCTGPCVVFTNIGPQNYKSQPQPMEHKIFKKVVYCLPSNVNEEKAKKEQGHAMLLGIQKVSQRTSVFFKMCDEHKVEELKARNHYVPTNDDRIFACSYDTFMKALLRHYPGVAKKKSHN